jgi:hypothetical protein
VETSCIHAVSPVIVQRKPRLVARTPHLSAPRNPR